MDDNSIKKVLDSAVGMALKDYLISELESLKDISNLESTTVIEVKAQTKAYKKLKAILENIISFPEGSKKKDPRDSFDVT